jgi:putative ABC transport system permease protein
VNPVAEWFRRIWYLVTRDRRDDELRADIEAHRAMMDNPGRFGSSLQWREASHDVWGWRWLDDLRQDIRYALRSLGAHKAFTATAVVTLALGIGATSAIFSVVSALVFRPLPFADPERLVQIRGSSPLTPLGDAVNNREAYQREAASFATIVGYEAGARYLKRRDDAERVMTVRADARFFEMLGVPPLRGRTFGAADTPAVAVISEVFWREHLNGDPSALGTTLTLDDQPVTIVGIMPASFQFPYSAASLLAGVGSEARTDLWQPLERDTRPVSRIGSVTGRLKPGVSLAAAESELKAIASRLDAELPAAARGRSVYLEPLAEAVVAPAIRRVLFLMFGAVGLLLALACANVANLSLARMSVRAKEVAVRSALGAGRGRLVRQLVTESLVLSLVGGGLGLLIAAWGTAQLVQAAATSLPRAHEIGVDWRVFAFLLSVCTAAGLALGVAPAVMASRDDARATQSALQQANSRSTMSAGQRRVRDALVVAEVAMAFVLAIGAAMLVRELIRLRNTHPGMETANVLTMHLGHRMTPRTDVRQFYEVARRARELPGVRAAGFIQMLPLQNWGWTALSVDFVVRGRPPVTPVFPIQLRYVTPGYFEALGIPIVKGRGLTDRDEQGAERVILLNETLARRYFGDDDPIGQATTRGTIVGVVRDVRQQNLDRPSVPEIYYPVAQNWSQLSDLGMTLVVAARDRPEPLTEPLRAIVRSVNPELAIFNVRTMERVLDDSMADFTLYLSLIAGFAVLALVLALTGTYGVIAYLASARTKEFAIRSALGANAGRVTRLVLGRGVALTLMGLAIGLAAAVLAAPLVNGLPITVRPPSAATVVPVAAFIALAALAACLVPALRAARVSPMVALRDE